jgi:hypothetical protein
MSQKSYRQGFFRPINHLKYQGDPTNIVYRSSWERIVFNWLDRSEACVAWSSEEFYIPYRSPVDDKMHRYFCDIKATFKHTDGTQKTYLIEIKPWSQTQPPRQQKNQRVLMEQVATYQVNLAKWAAARAYCEDRGWLFKIITEREIGLK